jgi:hypothetical protein
LPQRQDCVPDLELREEWLSFGRKTERCEHIWSASSLPQHPSQRAYKIVVNGIENYPFHPEIEDDWLLVHQATDPKRPSLTSFFPEKGEGDRGKALNNLPSLDYSQPS